MATIKFTNNASTILASDLSAGATTLVVAPGTGGKFPAITAPEYFICTLVHTNGTFEIVKVIARVGDNLTVVRAQEGTSALTFSAGDIIELRLTAGALEEIKAPQPIVDDILQEEVSNLIVRTSVGTEGKHVLTAVGTLSITSKSYYLSSLGSLVRLNDSSVESTRVYGSSSWIDMSYSQYIVGDSGKCYNVVLSNWHSDSKVQMVELSPKYGDVSSDFSVGGEYTVFVSAESPEPADQQTDTVDIVETFIGNTNIVLDELQTMHTTAGDGPYWATSMAVAGTSFINDQSYTQNTTLYDVTSTEHDISDGRLLTILVDSDPALIQYWDDQNTTPVDVTIVPGQTRYEITLPAVAYTRAELIIRIGVINFSTLVVPSITLSDSSYADLTNVLTDTKIYKSLSEQFTELAPDPNFTYPGTSGGWVLSTSGSTLPTINGGILDFASTENYSSCVIEGDYSEGRRYLLGVTVDSISSGALRVFAFPSTTDGTQGENICELPAQAGTYWCVIETDEDSTRIGIQHYLGTSDAQVSYFSIQEIPTTLYGTVNTGYWKGKNWVSQLLADCPETSASSGIRVLRSNRTILSGSLVVKVLDRLGGWHEFTAAPEGPLTANQYYFSALNNAVNVAISASYAGLGYASEAEMLELSCVSLSYPTVARRLRATENPAGIVALLKNTYVLGSYQYGYIAWELSGNVPVAANRYGQRTVPTTDYWLNPKTKEMWTWGGIEFADVQDSCPETARVAFTAGLYIKDGYYHVILWSNELIYDGAWSGGPSIPVVDYTQARKDTNGNTGIAGCYSYNTGIAATV